MMLNSSPIGSKVLKRGLLGLSCLGLLGIGCSAGSSEDAGSVGKELEAKSTLLSEIDVGYGVVRFHELVSPDGSRLISLSEQAPSNLKNTPLDQLFAANGRLTALEVFRAIAPDREAPALLVDSQAAEALDLGRGSDAVVAAAFERGAQVEKTLASCQNYVFADPGASGNWLSQSSTQYSGGANTKYVVSSSYFSTENVTIGICNESNVAVQGRRCWRVAGGSTTCEAYFTTAVNFMTRWWNYGIVSSCPAPPGQFCGLPVSANHHVDGSSSAGKAYDLASARLGPQTCSTSAECTNGQQCQSGICTFVIH